MVHVTEFKQNFSWTGGDLSDSVVPSDPLSLEFSNVSAASHEETNNY